MRIWVVPTATVASVSMVIASCEGDVEREGGGATGRGGTGAMVGGADGKGGMNVTGGAGGVAAADGSAGAGGGAGAGGAAGAGCGGDPQCYFCLPASCLAAQTVCDNNPDCVKIQECSSPCGIDMMCIQGCVDTNPAGGPEYNGFIKCVKDNCAEECPFIDDFPDGGFVISDSGLGGVGGGSAGGPPDGGSD